MNFKPTWNKQRTYKAYPLANAYPKTTCFCWAFKIGSRQWRIWCLVQLSFQSYQIESKITLFFAIVADEDLNLDTLCLVNHDLDKWGLALNTHTFRHAYPIWHSEFAAKRKSEGPKLLHIGSSTVSLLSLTPVFFKRNAIPILFTQDFMYVCEKGKNKMALFSVPATWSNG